MYTLSQLLAHLVGDYVLQSDWMAQSKTKESVQGWSAAVWHAAVYTAVFLTLTRSPAALLVICTSHLVIDHFRLARYVCWAKNFLAPRSYWHPWSECAGTGYHKDSPPWMSVWLMIIADNTMHLLINGLAIHYLGGGA